MKRSQKKLFDFIVCPHCMKSLRISGGTGETGANEISVLTCNSCERIYPLENGLPMFVQDNDDETAREGVAVDLDNAIALFREEIDPASRSSGRLFDDDLDKKDLIFLDIGCGIGRHLLVLRNNGIETALGFDIIPKLVHIARNDYRLENLFVANALHIPMTDGSVDRCLLYNAIEHCSEPGRVLREVYRVLKAGGVLYMDVPNARSMGDRIFRWGGMIVYGKTSHIQKFSLKKIEVLLKSVGFNIVKYTIKRGIFIDYPQLRRFGVIKNIIKLLFGNEVGGWELKLEKK